MSSVRVENATKDYQLGRTTVPALRGVSLAVERGEFMTSRPLRREDRGVKEPEARLDALRLMWEQAPFNRLLGLKSERLEPGHAVITLPVREDFVGDPRRPALHGGVVSALIDTDRGRRGLGRARAGRVRLDRGPARRLPRAGAARRAAARRGEARCARETASATCGRA